MQSVPITLLLPIAFNQHQAVICVAEPLLFVIRDELGFVPERKLPVLAQSSTAF